MAHGTHGAPGAGEHSIARVVGVSGSRVGAVLNPGVAASAASALQIGALLKMSTPQSTVYGMVSALSTPAPAHRRDEADAELRMLEMDLIGEAITYPGGAHEPFQRGVTFRPALGGAVLPTTQEDLKQVYARPTVPSVRVGTIALDRTLPAYVATDDLLGKHMAILGTTGSGKSCAVAQILGALLAEHDRGHVLLLDLHGEYARSFGARAEVLDTESLELPYWLLNFEEMREIAAGGAGRAEREADAAILKEAILAAKTKSQDGAARADHLSADTPVPYRLSDVVRQIDDALGKFDKATDSVPFLRLKERLSALQGDTRYAFMFPGLSVRDTMGDILSRLFRVPVDGKPLTILDLSGVPSEILNVVISLLCRLTFDFAMWAEREVPVLLVCEEAQRYMGQDSTLGFEPTKRALTRIAKEGRKYGVSLCLVSQRPADLAAEILSQCNTVFAMRMSNRTDQAFVQATLSDSAMGLMDALPSLRTGEAIAVGEGVSVPARICFDRLPEEARPHSGTAPFSTAWRTDIKDESFIAEIVERWRRQGR